MNKKQVKANIHKFLDQYARKKRPGNGEPNDRQYNRKLAKRVKNMKPEELDALIRDEE